MRIFIYKSEAQKSLRAFTSASDGQQLPAQLGPWQAIGVIRPDKDPPFGLSRETIETAIGEQGFQLFKVGPKKSAAA
jgi:hypothetical protein